MKNEGMMMVFGLTVLSAFFFVSAYSLQPECGGCSSHSECSTGTCRWGKCIYTPRPRSDHCFKRAECTACTKDFQCATEKCWKFKCVDGNMKSMLKCFKPECATCEKSGECVTEKCWNGKCVDDNFKSMSKCFTQICKHCTSKRDCITEKCLDNVCIPTGKDGMQQCRPPTKKECEPCKKSYECIDGLCKWGKCAKKQFWQSRHCFFKAECDSCWKGRECTQKKCIEKKCTDGTPESLKRCSIGPSPSPSPTNALLPKCAPCTSKEQCEENKCTHGLCGGPLGIRFCPKDECSDCTRKQECKTDKCWNYKCVNDTDESMKKCFP